MSSTILIVDDEPNIRRMLGALLRAEGFRTREAGSGRGALAEVMAEEPDAVLMDLYMADETGLDALPKLREAAPELPVVMMSGKASLSDAVRATKLGAFHFIEKPLTPEAVLLTLRSALELRKAREMNRALREELGEGEEMVGRSAPIKAVREMVDRVARTDARVLITGESGTGKEVVASAIHRMSPRAAGPFIRLNCAAIPRDLVESELFGHEKGSFTGATERRRGRFELASGGTLFLDEIGDLSLEAQAKLLRALEAGEIERVGGSEVISVDVRILAATNKELRGEVAAGRFREDLFFRLNVIPLHLPPLRERRDDVPLLVDHFLARNRARTGLRPPSLDAGAMDALARHAWPGNVRELANILERLAILHAGSDVSAAEIRGMLAGSAPAQAADVNAYRHDDARSLPDRLDDYERQLLSGALDHADGSVAEAARRLQTDRANLYRRMRRLGIER
ncbi:MAG TPA: sigma-54 dependent transcriptional regulator [Longimicrobiaceae bacterium]|jgi:two-component system nitrogen regulation response regulator NtrX|nr:sigma-54 dependent transcriptional regulator [Longimicrobiaceae bacterium]